jgi:hypothetical protein
VTNSRVKTESKCCALMGNGKYSTDKILSASEDNSFLEWSLTEMELSGWVQIVME